MFTFMARDANGTDGTNAALCFDIYKAEDGREVRIAADAADAQAAAAAAYLAKYGEAAPTESDKERIASLEASLAVALAEILALKGL